MLRSIALFELKYHLKSPLFAILFVILFAMTFGMITGDPSDGFGASNGVKWNSPYVIQACLMLMSILGTLTTTAFVVNSIHRDIELNTDALFFSRPVKKWQYMGGRFLGSFAAGFLIFVGVSIATLLGSFAPWVPKEHLGPVELWPHVYALAVMVIPNLLLAGALFFAVAALSRSLMTTYASVVVVAGLYVIANVLAEDTEMQAIAGIMDPFGVRALMLSMRYWTPLQKNTQLMPLEGVFLINRALWVSVSAAILAFAYARFSFTTGARLTKRQRAAKETPPAERILLPLPRVRQLFGGGTSWAQFRAVVRLEAITTLKSMPFLIMVLCGMALVAGNTVESDWLGTPYPLTREMVDAIRSAFSIFVLLIAAFYAGDIVWRERTLKLGEVTDALPVPTWLQWTAKLTSLLTAIMIALAMAVLTAMAMQTLRGYYNYEFGLYARAILGLLASRVALIAALAFMVQIFFNHKLAGLIGVVVYFSLNMLLPVFGLEHLLYRYAAQPQFVYSDMNGYGHFVAPLFWTTLYWILFAALMLAIGHLFWIRGSESGFFARLRIARQRLARPAAIAIAALFAGVAGTGCFIYYNTDVLNQRFTADQLEVLAARAEKTYKRYETVPQPRVTAVQANVHIHPERRAVYIDGSYIATNKTGRPVTELLIDFPAIRLTSYEASIDGATVVRDDRELGYQVLRLSKPLPPGRSLTMRFKTAYEARGFVNNRPNNSVVTNGTFINNRDYFPHIGYSARIELEEDREKHGLPPRERMLRVDDPKARNENSFARGSDFISLDTTVSTSADQIAVAPGYLQRQWTANGRRYFHYKTTSPIRGFFSYLSARYEVKRDHWRGIPIEIYYDAKHPYNVDRMIFAVKKSLDYFTANFSPYQHKQVRILEFPGYATFAQAFPNTIPYSENLGFVADLKSEKALDYVFYVTAHEIAHQWWGHQIVPANVQGATMLAETLAQYSALMVLEREFDQTRMRRYLRWELDRYLAGRGKETVREMPLALVERQEYVHYNKGAMAMYALREAIGEERINRALAKFLKDYAFSGPPYRAAVDLVQYLRAEAPPEAQELITDLFERVMIYENQTREASVTKRADGKYVVTMTVSTAKLRSDGKAEEHRAPNHDLVEIGVLGENDKPLFVEKRRFSKPVETLEIVVSEKPARAGIDPFYKMLDADWGDNMKSL